MQASHVEAFGADHLDMAPARVNLGTPRDTRHCLVSGLFRAD